VNKSQTHHFKISAEAKYNPHVHHQQMKLKRIGILQHSMRTLMN